MKISCKQVNNEERIVGVELLEDEPPTVEELEMELAEVLKEEDYEYAAILRDRINAVNLKK